MQITSKGQVTIPQHVRLRLGLLPHTEVEFEIVDDHARIRKSHPGGAGSARGQAALLAGKCFLTYRRRGGEKSSPLPDFYIGAHAAIEQLAILTQDAARCRTYFPKLEVLAPAKDSL